MEDRPSLLTCVEAARRLNVSEQTFRRMRQDGAIAEIVVSKRLKRIDPDVVDAYIRANQPGRLSELPPARSAAI